MKAILLAAGLGTRLRPLTENTPKCLVPICGKPLLGYWLEALVKLGIKDILINLHYLPQQVRDFVDKSSYKKYVQLVEERELLGTAGTLLVNRKFWQEQTTLVIHADNFCLSDLQGLIQQHNTRSPGADATVLLFETNSPQSCGVVKLDKRMLISEFHEKVDNPPTNIASGALFVFSPVVFELYFSHFTPGSSYELSIDVIPYMVNRLQGWMVDDFYIDIGTPLMLENANKKASKRFN